ncbi:hypothetical protein C8R48DRAFT_673503 [Suillus tomentosus]|nr:hypothetical protein C8R48DRAFT_673503 [Suillus tomentosus]
MNIRENLLPQISARVLDTSTSSCSAPNQSSPERREGARPLRSTSSCSKPSQSSPERREGTAGIATPKIEDARARATVKRGKVNILLTMLGHAGKLREKDSLDPIYTAHYRSYQVQKLCLFFDTATLGVAKGGTGSRPSMVHDSLPRERV